MINNGALKTNCRIVLAFASFNFDSTTYVPGIQNMTMTDIQNFTKLAHANGAKVSLSIGGATYQFATSDLYSRPGDLAQNINTVLMSCGFDGVDFDIEDNYNIVPADFANQAASLINTLRSLNPTLYITLTTPCQAWSQGMYQQQLLNLTIGNINAWQPMEYDLWIDPSNNYESQIQWDINYYLTTWNVSPSKIILGLMPGNDDMGHTLSLQSALNLTTFAQSKNLQGVMTWDANLDSKGQDGNAPYAYLMGIQSQLSKNQQLHQSCCVVV
jgi:chitinase